MSLYYLRHGVDLLIVFAISKRFGECSNAIDVFSVLGAMTEFEQIGVVAAVTLLAASVLTTTVQLWKGAVSFWKATATKLLELYIYFRAAMHKLRGLAER